MSNEPRRAGRHFLQIPGPSPVPDRILRAMDMPVLDHRGPEFQKLGQRVLDGHQDHLQDQGACDHLSGLGHRRLGSGAGQRAVARRSRADVRDRPLRDAVEEHGAQARPESRVHRDRTGAPASTPTASRRGCAADKERTIKAVCVVHNETSTGATSRIDEVRKAIDAAGHPALLMVDTISGARLRRLPA